MKVTFWIQELARNVEVMAAASEFLSEKPASVRQTTCDFNLVLIRGRTLDADGMFDYCVCAGLGG